MVAPVVGAAIYVGVLAITTTAGTVYYMGKKGDGAIDTLTKEAYDALVEEGVPILQSIAADVKAGLVAVGGAIGAALEAGLIDLAEALEELGPDILQGLSQAGAALANATLEVIEFAGPKLVDGIDNTYDYIRAKIRGSEPAIIEAITFGFLAVLTVVYIWNTAKKGA